MRLHILHGISTRHTHLTTACNLCHFVGMNLYASYTVYCTHPLYVLMQQES